MFAGCREGSGRSPLITDVSKLVISTSPACLMGGFNDYLWFILLEDLELTIQKYC